MLSLSICSRLWWARRGLSVHYFTKKILGKLLQWKLSGLCVTKYGSYAAYERPASEVPKVLLTFAPAAIDSTLSRRNGWCNAWWTTGYDHRRMQMYIAPSVHAFSDNFFSNAIINDISIPFWLFLLWHQSNGWLNCCPKLNFTMCNLGIHLLEFGALCALNLYQGTSFIDYK